ncbi:hypothetical protein ACJJTC_005375 [Scirpophaga incertulas]
MEKSNVEIANGILTGVIENLKSELNDREQELLLNDLEITCVPEQKANSSANDFNDITNAELANLTAKEQLARELENLLNPQKIEKLTSIHDLLTTLHVVEKVLFENGGDRGVLLPSYISFEGEAALANAVREIGAYSAAIRDVGTRTDEKGIVGTVPRISVDGKSHVVRIYACVTRK